MCAIKQNNNDNNFFFQNDDTQKPMTNYLSAEIIEGAVNEIMNDACVSDDLKISLSELPSEYRKIKLTVQAMHVGANA